MIKKESAIILMSGGLDSTVCATDACFRHNKVLLLMFNYGQRMFVKEKEAVNKIYNYLRNRFTDVDISLEIVPILFLAELGGSYLTDHSKDVTVGESALSSPTAWVPARNLVMISIAAAYCDAKKFDNIYIGVNAEEGETYPDNTIDFIEKFDKLLLYSLLHLVTIKAPLYEMTKNDIVAYGKKINAPMLDSWSCYFNDDKHCGVCASCQIKKMAFNNLDYEYPLDYWKD